MHTGNADPQDHHRVQNLNALEVVSYGTSDAAFRPVSPAGGGDWIRGAPALH